MLPKRNMKSNHKLILKNFLIILILSIPTLGRPTPTDKSTEKKDSSEKTKDGKNSTFVEFKSNEVPVDGYLSQTWINGLHKSILGPTGIEVASSSVADLGLVLGRIVGHDIGKKITHDSEKIAEDGQKVGEELENYIGKSTDGLAVGLGAAALVI